MAEFALDFDAVGFVLADELFVDDSIFFRSAQRFAQEPDVMLFAKFAVFAVSVDRVGLDCLGPAAVAGLVFFRAGNQRDALVESVEAPPP